MDKGWVPWAVNIVLSGETPIQYSSKGILHPMSSCTSVADYRWFHTPQSTLIFTPLTRMILHSPFVQQKPPAQPFLRVPAASEAGKGLESHSTPGWKNILLQSRGHNEIRWGCTVLYPNWDWEPPKMEMVHPPWTTSPNAWLSSWGKSSSLHPVGPSLVHACCLLPATHDCEWISVCVAIRFKVRWGMEEGWQEQDKRLRGLCKVPIMANPPHS